MKKREPWGWNALFDDLNLGDQSNIENHILMLQSYTITNQALQNLKMDVSWYKKGLFRDVSLYDDAPFVGNQNARAG